MIEKMTSPLAGKRMSVKEPAEKRVESQDLFCGKQEIIIEHAGHAYRLRITRQGKLILTK